MSKFKKNQIIYSVSTRFSRLEGVEDRNGRDIDILAVIERQVDACGVKQMTFASRDGSYNDSIFGKKAYAPFSNYFETEQEAFAYAKTLGGLVIDKVYSDATNQIFADYRNNQVKFL